MGSELSCVYRLRKMADLMASPGSGLPLVSILSVLLVCYSLLSAQEKDTLPTLAILDFEPQGVSLLAAETLTDHLATEMTNTGAVRLVDRKNMRKMLRKQGVEQTRCTTDECALHVGTLLGVKYVVIGSISKLGNRYRMEAKMLSVASGTAQRTVNITYQGEIDGLVTEIEVLAWEIVASKVPENLSKKRRLSMAGPMREEATIIAKSRTRALVRSIVFPGLGQIYLERNLWGYGWMLAEGAIGGLIYNSYNKFQMANTDYDQSVARYNQAIDADDIARYKAEAKTKYHEMKVARRRINILIEAGAGIWLGNVIHAFLVGSQLEAANVDKRSQLKLAYDPATRQTWLGVNIALDR